MKTIVLYKNSPLNLNKHFLFGLEKGIETFKELDKNPLGQSALVGPNRITLDGSDTLLRKQQTLNKTHLSPSQVFYAAINKSAQIY